MNTLDKIGIGGLCCLLDFLGRLLRLTLSEIEEDHDLSAVSKPLRSILKFYWPLDVLAFQKPPTLVDRCGLVDDPGSSIDCRKGA